MDQASGWIIYLFCWWANTASSACLHFPSCHQPPPSSQAGNPMNRIFKNHTNPAAISNRQTSFSSSHVWTGTGWEWWMLICCTVSTSPFQECAVCSLHWNSSLTKESLLTCSACAGLPHRAVAFTAVLNCTLAHCVLRSGCILHFIAPKKLHIMYIDNEESCPCSFSLFDLWFLVSSSLLACCRPW